MNNINEYSEEYMREWNKYFYPNTNVLINKLNITDLDELHQVDAELSFKRMLELSHTPYSGEFNKRRLLSIHGYLFQDLYDWAGQYRTVYMGKNSSYFAAVSDIDSYLDDTFKLMDEELKVIHSYQEFVSYLARYYVILLNIHPFREGNGRTIKQFFTEFVLAKSKEVLGDEYELNWGNMDFDALERAMVLARTFKGPIEAEFMKALVKVEKKEEYNL